MFSTESIAIVPKRYCYPIAGVEMRRLSLSAFSYEFRDWRFLQNFSWHIDPALMDEIFFTNIILPLWFDKSKF